MNIKLQVSILVLLALSTSIAVGQLTPELYKKFKAQVTTMPHGAARTKLEAQLKAYEAKQGGAASAAPAKVAPAKQAGPTPEAKRAAEKREAERRRLEEERRKAAEEGRRPERGGKNVNAEIDRLVEEVAELLHNIHIFATKADRREIIDELKEALESKFAG